MAQETSALWKTLLRSRNTIREYAFDINGVWYGPEAEVSNSSEVSLFDSFGIGNAMSGTLKMSLFANEIQRGAVIKRYIRLTDGKSYSEWLPKGVFFTNRRSVEDGFWTLEAYDAMLKADITWTPRLPFPCTMQQAAQDIAAAMDVELDPRNVYLPYTMRAYPDGEYMRRDALCDIAAAHGGNWFISDTGKLRLVPLISFPPETNYLVEEHGDNIAFGGINILLSYGGTNNKHGIDGAEKFFVGLDVTGFEDNGKRMPITSVTLQVNENNTVTSGVYSGIDLYAVCPYGTQEMANEILFKVNGYQYQAFTADAANIDPAAELGDGVDVGGIYGVLSAISDNGDGYPDISAPGDEELEDEYPYQSRTQRQLTGGVDELRAFITRSLGELSDQVTTLTGRVEVLTQTMQQISNAVTQLESRVSKLEGK